VKTGIARPVYRLPSIISGQRIAGRGNGSPMDTNDVLVVEVFDSLRLCHLSTDRYETFHTYQ